MKAHNRLNKVKYSNKEYTCSKLFQFNKTFAENLPLRGVREHQTETGEKPSANESQIIAEKNLPHCPLCDPLIRPAVVWSCKLLIELSSTVSMAGSIKNPRADLMLVVRTNNIVCPAAAYIRTAKV
jgi:NAD-dependent SIR2 family protein deacetylase